MSEPYAPEEDRSFLVIGSIILGIFLATVVVLFLIYGYITLGEEMRGLWFERSGHYRTEEDRAEEVRSGDMSSEPMIPLDMKGKDSVERAPMGRSVFYDSDQVGGV